MALSEIRYTLVTDGSTDSVLLRHIDWVISQHTSIAVRSIWADLSRLPKRPQGLTQRIQTALDLYPCDILCVHRDAEREEPGVRVREIQSAASTPHLPSAPIICVVPVRMQEAWLLFDEGAIRRAAGNPRGRVRLMLPKLKDIESVPDPKEVLYDLLRTASEFNGRRLKNFRSSSAARLVGEHISDFTPLRMLPAFAAFEAGVIEVLTLLGA